MPRARAAGRLSSQGRPRQLLARAAYLKQLLAKLDAIPAARLSLDEQTNAAVLRNVVESSPLRRAVPRMGDAGQFGQQFLDLSRRIATARRCRRLSPLHRPDARRAALFRREYRQHARRPSPRLHARPRSRSAAAKDRSPPSPPRPTPTLFTAPSSRCLRPSAPPTRPGCAPRARRRSSRPSSPPIATC